MSFPIKTLVITLLCIMTTACQTEMHKKSIQQIRNRSNQAFREQNIADIASYLTDDIVITTGSGALIHGKDSLHNYLAVVYAKNPDLYFVRKTTMIKINQTKDRAWETGTWKGFRPKTPDWNAPGGRYSAMWIKTAGSWKIRSELFVQLY